MAARLGALRDNGINPPLLERSRLGYRRRTRDDEHANGLEGLDSLRIGQAEMKAHHFGLGFKQQREVLVPEVTDHAFRFWHRPEPMRIVLWLKLPLHCLDDIRSATRIRPNRIIDIDAAAALLTETGDPTRRLLGGSSPHPEPTEAAGVGDGGSERRGARAAHRCLKDRPFQVQPFGEGIARPHGDTPFNCRKPLLGLPRLQRYGATARIASSYRPPPILSGAKIPCPEIHSRASS